MRIAHTMIRVVDLDKSIRFYTDILGMRLQRKQDFPEGRFTLAFVGYGDENDHASIELTHNWDVESYQLGDAFGHIAIEVADVYVCVEQMRQAGAKIVREAGPMKHGTTVIAFVEDPDGYKVELIGR